MQLLLITLLVICGLQTANCIIGGHLTYQGQFRYFVSLNVTSPTSTHFCGGTLIHRQWVLTSANCVFGAVLFTIQAGAISLVSEDPYRVTVATSTYYAHPDFNSDTFENDIGLIKLRIPIDESLYVGLATLALEDIVGARSLWTIGFGQISDDDVGLSNDLYYADVNSMTTEECKIVYGNQIYDTMICAIGNYNEGTCIGDTGGPLILPYMKLHQVVGVSSFISANGCESVYPSGYTRVYPYLDWINSIINVPE